MTAILSQMDDRHYATYIETFSGTSDLVVSTHTHTHTHTCGCLKTVSHCIEYRDLYIHTFSFSCPFAAGLPDGVLPTFQGPDWETCVSL